MSRSVLITGGNRGIGLATARLLAEQGHRVAVTSRERRGRRPADGEVPTSPTARQLDDAFAVVEEEHGPVEVLVANAGITEDQLLLRMSEESFERVLDTNLTVGLPGRQARLRPMLASAGAGCCSSPASSGCPGSAGQASYAASKAGLVGLHPVAGPRARGRGHHQQRGRARLRRHRHDRGAHRRPPRAGPRQHPGRPYGARLTRSPP